MGENPLSATTIALEDRFLKRKRREGEPVSAPHHALVRDVCRMLAEELMSSASQLKKSTKMGWRWLDWDMDLVPAEVAALAIEAVDAAKLDMGAVSVSHVDGVARVLSITTAPALSEEQMALYVGEIQSFIQNDGKTKDLAAKREAKKKRLAGPELVARLYRRVKGLSAEKAEEVLQALED